DCLALRQCRAARRRQFNHGVAVGGLSQITQPYQLPRDSLPLRSRVFPADSVSREFVMPPFADFFRVGAGEHLDGMIQAEVEATLFTDAINTRQKFLRGERAVPGLAGRQAVVAPAAVGF